MSDNDDDLDGDDGTDNAGGNANAPKVLRQQVTKLNKEKADLESELAKYKRTERERTVAEELEKAGASPKLAKFVDKDDVQEWLKENGEVFGWSEGQGTDDDDPDTMEEARRIRRAADVAPQRQLGKPITPESIRGMSYEEGRKAGIFL